MNIQHMTRDDNQGTVCGAPQVAIPLGEVVAQCQTCLGIYTGKLPLPVTEPCIAVPEGFQGTEAEAVALAVAGAIQAISGERDLAQAHLEGTAARLSALASAYPRTSFAASEAALEEAVAWLSFLGQKPEPTPPT